MPDLSKRIGSGSHLVRQVKGKEMYQRHCEASPRDESPMKKRLDMEGSIFKKDKVPAIVQALADKVKMIPIAWNVHPSSVVIVFKEGPKITFDREAQDEVSHLHLPQVQVLRATLAPASNAGERGNPDEFTPLLDRKKVEAPGLQKLPVRKSIAKKKE